MKVNLSPDGPWYHGSDKLFDLLEAGSTVTQWYGLAAAFSHQPSHLSYGDYGNDSGISHNGTAHGYMYIIDEPVELGKDIFIHPRTVMDEGAELLTSRPLKVRLTARL